MANDDLNILITGGAGAIGSSLANHLTDDENVTVDIVDDLTSGFEVTLDQKKNLNFHEGSILDDAFMEKFYGNSYDYIFHLAALFANQTSVERPLDDLSVNSAGSIKVLELAKHQKDLKKFVYTSSSCIYGNSEHEEMAEHHKPSPDTPYAISKLTAEYYTNYFRELYDVPMNILRLFNIYGSNELPGKYRNVIPNFVHRALNGLDITVMGDGSDTRDFTHIEDALEMIVGVGFDEDNDGEVFNIGSGGETKIVDLANAIVEGTNSSSNIIFVPKRHWDTISKRKAHTGKISKYKESGHKHLHKGLVTVFDFMDDMQHHITDDLF